MANSKGTKGNKTTVNKVNKGKETKVMAKETKVYTIEIKANEDDMKKVNDMLTEMKLVHKEITVSAAQGKTSVAKASKPVDETPAKVQDTKENDEFDREKYLEVGEKLGVKYISKKDGTERVYGFARKIVYKAMDEQKLTAKKIQAYKDEIMEKAKGNKKIQRYFKVV